VHGFVHKLTARCLPLTFVAAGGGMVWLYRVRSAEGDFYARMNAHVADWVGSHLVLLASAILIIPAAVALWRAVGDGKGSVLASIGLIMAVPGAVFLAGQYAIDFIMPIIADVGGDAHVVHERFFTTEPLNTLFYGLPALGSIALLVQTIGLMRSGKTSRLELSVLLVLWGAVILGNLVHPLVQRVALLLLGFAYIPTARRLLAGSE
jgi:hypothetical protein